MFKLFKKRSEREKLEKKYKLCLEQAHKLSKSNRSASDDKIYEANKILEKLKSMDSETVKK